MQFLEVEVQFTDPKKNFRVFTNLPVEGGSYNFTGLVEDWKGHTKDHARNSLIKYFMGKDNPPKTYMFGTEKEVLRHFRYKLK